MKPYIAIIALILCVAGCGKKEAAVEQPAAPRESKPLADTIAAQQDAAPAPPPTTPTSPGPGTAEPPAAENAAPKLAPSVYENISPAQLVAAERDKHFRDWALAFRGGTDQQKKNARAAVAKLSAEERAAFEAFCKQYGVKFQ